jgi:hypothetical protein
VLAAALIALFLIVTLLIARQWPAARQPLSRLAPLDRDFGMPFPEAGQGSSVFSLTALFGPYLALAVVIGPSAILGLGTGTVSGLLMVRHIVSRHTSQSFQGALLRRFDTTTRAGCYFLLLIAVTQLGFATSEVLILRQLAMVWLGMNFHTSSIFAVSLALIGYIYCLDGGYLSVFRTDVIQYVFIVLMCLVIAVTKAPEGLAHLINSLRSSVIQDFWLPSTVHPIVRFCLSALVTFVMGAAFIIASPDTWKRVFVVVHYRARKSILLLICAGLLPFALITPVFLPSSPIAVDRIAGLAFISDQLKSLDTLGMVIVLLGLVAGFLSAFDSALLTAVHLSVLGRFYPSTKPSDTLDTFRQQIGLLFLLLNVLLVALPAMGMHNPYFLANLLLGHYAVIAGLLCGTLGFRRALPAHQLVSVSICGIASWYMYMLTRPGLTTRPTAAHLTSIPFGVILFLLTGVAAYYCQRRRQHAAF